MTASNLFLVIAFFIGCFGISRSGLGSIHLNVILCLLLGIGLTLISWWISPNVIVTAKQSIAVFKCNFNVVMRFGYPGNLLMRYPSALGDTASCPNIALYVEVINTQPTTATRILSYRCRALLKYDEGGQVIVSDNPSGGWKYAYKPSGRVVEKWQTLHSMGILGNNVYFWVSPLKKWKRIDFTQNGFDNLASSEQMPPGGSIKGWIFLEFENDELRLQMPEIKEIELTLWDSVGEQEKCLSSREIKLSDDVNNLMRAGDWRLEAGLYDFTKDKFTVVPMVDLPKTLKEGGQFLKSKGIGQGYDVLNYKGLKNDK